MAITYLVDTNTISEIELMQPNSAVVNRFEEHRSQIAIASISWHELLFGYHRLPESKRKQRVGFFIEQIIASTIPILPFDSEAAEWFAVERARLTTIGRPPSYPDGQIASIAAVNGLTLVTRNFVDFENFQDLEIENWFQI